MRLDRQRVSIALFALVVVIILYFMFQIVSIAERLQAQQSTKDQVTFVKQESTSQELMRIVHGICPRHNLSVAIVVPFIESQIPALKENLRTWAQEPFFPCSSLFRQHFEQAEGSLRSPNAPFGPLFQHKMRLFFYFNNNFSKRIEQDVLSSWKEIESSENRNTEGSVLLKECFAGGPPKLLWADLNEQQMDHVVNTGRQFENLFDLMAQERVDYFFQMEPDAWPVRQLWTEKIFTESLCGNDFWIKGSTFRNANLQHLRNMGYHLNGNALYNARDQNFVGWVKSSIAERRWVPYDVLLANSLRRNPLFFRDHAHMFLHVDWIYNYGNRGDFDWRPWRLEQVHTFSPTTYILHGKKYPHL